jgi:hypothetical protein
MGRRTRNGMIAAVIAGLLAVPGFALAAEHTAPQRTEPAGAPAPAAAPVAPPPGPGQQLGSARPAARRG